MQRDPLQHRIAGLGDPGRTLFSADLVETSAVRARRVCSDDCEEWDSNRYANNAGELRGSRISLWQSPPGGRSGVFSDWIIANGSGFLAITDRRARTKLANRENTRAGGRKLTGSTRPTPSPPKPRLTSSPLFRPLRCHSRNNNCCRCPRNRRG